MAVWDTSCALPHIFTPRHLPLTVLLGSLSAHRLCYKRDLQQLFSHPETCKRSVKMLTPTHYGQPLTTGEWDLVVNTPPSWHAEAYSPCLLKGLPQAQVPVAHRCDQLIMCPCTDLPSPLFHLPPFSNLFPVNRSPNRLPA